MLLKTVAFDEMAGSVLKGGRVVDGLHERPGWNNLLT